MVGSSLGFRQATSLEPQLAQVVAAMVQERGY
jgi:hypothetical protein